MANKLTGNILETFNKVTERTGNVVSIKKDEGITLNSILDAFEKMAIDFDESGNPIMPEIHVSPDDHKRLNSLKIDPQTGAKLEKRRKEILDKKRKEWASRENNRKLVD